MTPSAICPLDQVPVREIALLEPLLFYFLGWGKFGGRKGVIYFKHPSPYPTDVSTNHEILTLAWGGGSPSPNSSTLKGLTPFFLPSFWSMFFFCFFSPSSQLHYRHPVNFGPNLSALYSVQKFMRLTKPRGLSLEIILRSLIYFSSRL